LRLEEGEIVSASVSIGGRQGAPLSRAASLRAASVASVSGGRLFVAGPKLGPIGSAQVAMNPQKSSWPASVWPHPRQSGGTCGDKQREHPRREAPAARAS